MPAALAWLALAYADAPACADAVSSGAYDLADQACRACTDRAAWCEGRLAWLAARRDPDGTWTNASRLEAVRRGGPDVAAEIEGDPGANLVIRAEAALWLALRARREGRPAEAADLAAPWVDAEIPPEIARALAVERATALAELGHHAAAEAALDPARVPAESPRPTPVDRARSERVGRRVAAGAMAGLALWTATTLPRVRAGAVVVPAVGVLAAVLLASWGLLEAYESGAGRPVLWLAAGLVPVVAWSSRALTGTPEDRRLPVRIASGVAAVAAAWLAAWGGGFAPWP